MPSTAAEIADSIINNGHAIPNFAGMMITQKNACHAYLTFPGEVREALLGPRFAKRHPAEHVIVSIVAEYFHLHTDIPDTTQILNRVTARAESGSLPAQQCFSDVANLGAFIPTEINEDNADEIAHTLITAIVKEHEAEERGTFVDWEQEKPQPITIDLLPVPKLPPAMLPVAARPWIVDIARRMSCPLEFPAIPAIIAMSSVVGRKIAIRPKVNDRWKVIPNLFGVVVQKAGTQKTPPTLEGLMPLKRLEKEALDQHDADKKENAKLAAVIKAKSKAAQAKLDKAAKDEMTDEDLLGYAEGAVEEPEVPALKRYFINDSTIEALGERLRENPNGLLVYRDELKGFLKNLEKQGHESDREFYLEAWNGNATNYIYDRISRGVVIIPTVCLSMFGTIQPGPLFRYLRQSGRGDDADGFFQRFQIMAYPDLVDWVHVDEWPAKDPKNAAYQLFVKLASLTAEDVGATADEDDGIPYLHFSTEAQTLFVAWWTELETKKLRKGENAMMESHLSKYRSLMPSLALLFHLIDICGDPALKGPVSLSATERAAAWCEFLEAHARRIYQAAFDADIDAADTLSKRIKQSLTQPFTPRDILIKGWSGLTTAEEVDRAIEFLVEKKWLKIVEIPPGPKGGRPTSKIFVNPDVYASNTKGEES